MLQRAEVFEGKTEGQVVSHLTPLIKVVLTKASAGQARFPVTVLGEAAKYLPKQRGGTALFVHHHAASGRTEIQTDKANTLLAMAGDGRERRAFIIRRQGDICWVRTLMPIEAERLMGFPEGSTDIEVKDSEGNSVNTEGPRIRAMGNSMAVPVMKWLAYASREDMAEGRINKVHNLDKDRLEAHILEVMKDRPAAQKVRWAAFEQTLNADILRDYIAKLGDFEEFDELDRAFAVAAASPRPYSALALLLQWPRPDLAAKLVIDRRQEWDGRNYDILAEAADMLEGESPLAATILYRALLNDILDRKRSPAYGHGARYLARLAHLVASLPADMPIEDHAVYFAGLKAAHGRKHGFWSLVK